MFGAEVVSLPVEGHMPNAAVHSVLLYGCATWPLPPDVHRFELLNYHCLGRLTVVGWSDKVIGKCGSMQLG